MSDADIQQAFDYFKAGKPGTLQSCTNSGNDLCGNGVDFTPLFVADAADTREPIVKKDANGHLIYRGAGRVRFRHEMEPEFATYHGHYFEGRTFGYVIDDAVAAGGDTLTVTFLPTSKPIFQPTGRQSRRRRRLEPALLEAVRSPRRQRLRGQRRWRVEGRLALRLQGTRRRPATRRSTSTW